MKVFIQKFSLMLLLIFIVQTVQAAMVTESIRLHHKDVSDIIPLVKPFLAKDAVVSGDGTMIVIKTTPANLQEVKEIIASFDTPVHKLEISLSYNPEVLKENSVKNKVITPPIDNSRATIRIHKPGEDQNKTEYYTTKGRQVESDLYTLQVLEDKWATIKTGHAVPQVERRKNADGTVTESIEYRQVNSGFHVRPKLKGDKVLLDISAFGESDSPQGGGRFKNYQTTSTVESRVGYWTTLSAISGEPIYDKKNKTYSTRNRSSSQRRIFLKVDVIP